MPLPRSCVSSLNNTILPEATIWLDLSSRSATGAVAQDVAKAAGALEINPRRLAAIAILFALLTFDSMNADRYTPAVALSFARARESARLRSPGTFRSALATRAWTRVATAFCSVGFLLENFK